MRAYPFGQMAAHTLGYVGLITEDALAEANQREEYGPNDMIGRPGSRSLRDVPPGHAGAAEVHRERRRRDDPARRREIEPMAGDDLHLTMDADRQRIAEEELAAGMRVRRALNDSERRRRSARPAAPSWSSTRPRGRSARWRRCPTYDPRWYVEGLTEDAVELPRQRHARAVGEPGVSAWPTRRGRRSSRSPRWSRTTSCPTSTCSGSYPCVTSYVHGTDEAHPFENWSDARSDIGCRCGFDDALRMSCDTFFYRFGSEFYQYWVDNQLSEDAQPLQRGAARVGVRVADGDRPPGRGRGLVPDAGVGGAQREDTPTSSRTGRGSRSATSSR